MSCSVDLLDAFKAAMGGVSDYKAAQLLGVKQPTMSGWRHERCPMSPEKVLLACEMADLDAVDWLLRLYRERARCDKEKSIIDDLRHRAAA